MPNALDVWLKRGKKIEVGGKSLWMMPLPLSKLYPVFDWIEENATDVVNDFVKSAEPGKAPNPLVLVTRVLSRVDLPSLAANIFSFPKNPDTNQPLNEVLTKEFFDDYLDIPTAQNLVQMFMDLNDLPNLIKNLQSLPVTQKVMEAASLTFGIPYLNSLLANTGLTQSKLEGSPSRKSIDSSKQSVSGGQVLGTPNQEKPATTLLQ